MSNEIILSADIPAALKNFDSLPDSASVRLPVVQGLYGCSPATAWRWVREGKMPQPKRRGRITSWNVGELRASLAK